MEDVAELAVNICSILSITYKANKTREKDAPCVAPINFSMITKKASSI